MGETENRISLAEVARRSGKAITRGDSRELEQGAPPTLKDLAEALHFALGDGRIWLNDQRMVLMQSQVLGRLRQEFIDALGIEAAKAMFMRVGYMQGVRDAELIEKRFPQKSLTQALAAGPRVHTLEGFVKVTTKHFEFDTAKGSYYGEFHWHDSSEAAEHLASYGLSTEPVCWLQCGYPSGYTTRLMGRPVIFREIECVGTGAPHCVVIGRDAEAWGPDAPERQYFGLEWKGRRRAYATKPAVAEAAAAVRSDQFNSGVAVGVSAGFIRTWSLLEKVAPTDATVLLMGESGVGKELFSNQIHQMSRRARGPFVAINCAAIPENLVESELFGVERGAFTGAAVSRAGHFERAAGGTLFLDEIASLQYSAQGKLLRALQERKIERVGGARTISADVRIVAASNVDLAQEVRAGRFRQDLYFRLCVLPIVIPPLRERRDDIPLLMQHFLQLNCERHGKTINGFSRRAIDALLKYDYPGNVRELQNLIERGAIYCDDGRQIELHHIFTGHEPFPAGAPGLTPDGHIGETADAAASRSPASGAARPGPDSPEALKEMERELYRSALERTGGNVSAAARGLNLTRARFEHRARKFGLLWP
jgi:DNA-binding NtrC family response regulator/predicted hydrocarbon binding protein